jgi:hypothetical protein
MKKEEEGEKGRSKKNRKRKKPSLFGYYKKALN